MSYSRGRLYPVVRGMLRVDIKKVVVLDRECYSNLSEHLDNPWTSVEITRFMRSKRNYGLTCEHREQVLGYSFFSIENEKFGINRKFLHIVRFGVDPQYRRREVGAAIMERLQHTACEECCDYLLYYVEDNNLSLGSQLFLRDSGFTCLGTLQEGNRSWLKMSLLINRGRINDYSDESLVKHILSSN